MSQQEDFLFFLIKRHGSTPFDRYTLTVVGIHIGRIKRGPRWGHVFPSCAAYRERAFTKKAIVRERSNV